MHARYSHICCLSKTDKARQGTSHARHAASQAKHAYFRRYDLSIVYQAQLELRFRQANRLMQNLSRVAKMELFPQGLFSVAPSRNGTVLPFRTLFVDKTPVIAHSAPHVR